MTDKVKYMIDNFMYYHNEGKSIKEIAEICKITERTIYSKLETIAKNNHVSRESLLQVPHKLHRKPVTPQFHKPHKKRKVEISQEDDQKQNSNEKKEGDNHLNLQQESQIEEVSIVGVEDLLAECRKAYSRVEKLLSVIDEVMELNGRNQSEKR